MLKIRSCENTIDSATQSAPSTNALVLLETLLAAVPSIIKTPLHFFARG
jgi:hypothetical protein